MTNSHCHYMLQSANESPIFSSFLLSMNVFILQIDHVLQIIIGVPSVLIIESYNYLLIKFYFHCSYLLQSCLYCLYLAAHIIYRYLSIISFIRGLEVSSVNEIFGKIVLIKKNLCKVLFNTLIISHYNLIYVVYLAAHIILL